MPIPAECPNCQARVRLPENAEGRRFRCPKCQAAIPGPPARSTPPKQAVVRPAEQVDPGFVDAPDDPAQSQQIEEPAPISPAARKAVRGDFNPFDDGRDDDDDEPRGKRRRKPKEDYNPFAEPAAQSAAGAANPDELFDFGAVDPNQPSPTGEFDFGASDETEERDPRRRRR
jgi:hypothetical protein